MLVGVDYGSKLAGTTVIAFTKNDQVFFLNSAKKQDADLMIIEFLDTNQAEIVGIDAPLSLPKVYFAEGDDFFYRACDRAVQAMSPMFLGGLTARAMKLNAHVKPNLVEVYPGALARGLDLKKDGYKGRNPNYEKMIAELDWPYVLEKPPTTSHQLDAVLALYIVWKIKDKRATVVGEATEGLIYY